MTQRRSGALQEMFFLPFLCSRRTIGVLCVIALHGIALASAAPPDPLGPAYQASMVKAVDRAAPPDRQILVNGTTVTSVAWYNVDTADSTESISAAVQSKAAVIVFPRVASDWVTGPIKIPSGKTLVLADGATVRALAGQFLRGNDCLFSADNVRNVSIIGYGARLAMNKSDYMKAPYPSAEWRTGIQFRGSTTIRIEGVTVASTGGDGIYLGATPAQPYCADVLVTHVRLLNNYRQGISVISARDLLIDSSSILFTNGHNPMAGIDFEPNPGSYGFENCIVRNTELWMNTGGSIFIIIPPGRVSNKRISITVEDCFFGAPRQPPRILIEDTGLEGVIRFTGSSQGLIRLQDNQSKVSVFAEVP